MAFRRFSASLVMSLLACLQENIELHLSARMLSERQIPGRERAQKVYWVAYKSVRWFQIQKYPHQNLLLNGSKSKMRNPKSKIPSKQWIANLPEFDTKPRNNGQQTYRTLTRKPSNSRLTGLVLDKKQGTANPASPALRSTTTFMYHVCDNLDAIAQYKPSDTFLNYVWLVHLLKHMHRSKSGGPISSVWTTRHT